MRCSKLSSSSSKCFARRAAVSCAWSGVASRSSTPSRCAMVGSTSAGSRSGARSTNTAPSAKASAARTATFDCQARFPHPTGSRQREQLGLATPQQLLDRARDAVAPEQRRERARQGARRGRRIHRRGVRRGTGAGGGEEARPLGGPQAQRVGQQRHGVETRRAGRAALQLADGLGAHPRALGQRLLRQARS